jgi:hypothetical protein
MSEPHDNRAENIDVVERFPRRVHAALADAVASGDIV